MIKVIIIEYKQVKMVLVMRSTSYSLRASNSMKSIQIQTFQATKAALEDPLN